ncbi:hypothetical protein LUZ63_003667 [Rhynchospora breviuscula]|uniref:FAR1 domain-containing protein n=1 Tax=Rhynchospora breviuscula TaxID=2022672 RepID=A0A9Q0I075_9POAL|nr:hypothetical protein LUZ63_003667 [Rhynchospora breviuscula]
MSTSGSTNAVDDDEQVQLRLGVSDPYMEVEELCRFEEELGSDEEELGSDEEEHCFDEEEHCLDEPTKPYVGMQFSSAEEAYIFYNSYAGRVGFSVRKSSKSSSRTGPSSQRFLCSKEGFCKNQKIFEMPIGSVSLDNSPQKVKSITRVGCRASLRVRRMKDGIWHVSVFVEEHNHVLITSPSKMRGLRSQKSLSEEEVKMICDLNAQNVEPSKIVEYIASQSGGKKYIRFKKKDVSNKISQENRKLVGRDVETTLIYFRKKQEVDKDFFYEVDVDDDGVDELAAVINRSLTIDDFQDQWTALIDRHKLGNVKHLKNMFGTRHEWVPAYFRGLLCSHAIKVMQHVGFLHLPDHYVLKRWTKDANVASKYRSDALCRLEEEESQQLEEHRLATLKSEFYKLARIGSKSAGSFARMKCRIDDLKEEFVETRESDSKSDPDSDEIASTEEVSMKVYDPYVSQCKGKRKKPTRFKPAADVGVKKRRRCKVCSQIAGHNARTCPMALGNRDK